MKKVLIAILIICMFVLPASAKTKKKSEPYNGPQPILQPVYNKYSVFEPKEVKMPANVLRANAVYTTLPEGVYKYTFQNIKYGNTGVTIYKITKDKICELYIENYNIDNGSLNNACFTNKAQKTDNFYLISGETVENGIYRKTYFSLDLKKITWHQFYKNYKELETFEGYLIEKAP